MVEFYKICKKVQLKSNNKKQNWLEQLKNEIKIIHPPKRILTKHELYFNYNRSKKFLIHEHEIVQKSLSFIHHSRYI